MSAGRVSSTESFSEDKGVHLTSTTQENLPPVFADGDRVVQVLVETEDRGDSVVFGIEDTREGIAAGHLPHVFKHFYRAEKSRSRSEDRGGSDLGLAISKVLVEAMGGSVDAENPGTGKGAKFSFSLSVADR